MNKLVKWVIEKPLSEVTFKWFDRSGNEVEYGKHVPWLFEVSGKDIDTIKVRKVELPVCDYGSNDKDPIVKIYCEDVVKED